MQDLKHEFQEKIRVNQLAIGVLYDSLEYYERRIGECMEELTKLKQANENYQKYIDSVEVKNDRF